MDEKKTMSIKDFAKMWGIGEAAMRRIIDENSDFPVIVVNTQSKAKRKKRMVITDEANNWVRRNMRQ